MPATNADSYTRTWNTDGEIAAVALPDGTRLRYLKTGEGPALVLLHTLRTQLDYFQRLIPLLADRFTIYAVDFPALGWSDITPGTSYEEPALRKAVVDFIETLGLEDVTLVGESDRRDGRVDCFDGDPVPHSTGHRAEHLRLSARCGAREPTR